MKSRKRVMCKARPCLMLLGVFLTSCSPETPSAVSLNDLDGVYFSDPCPAINITNGSMKVGDDSIDGRLISIKGDDILVTNRSIRFVETNRRCSLILVPEPIYNSVMKKNSEVTIDIFSGDRTLVRTWTKAK